MQKLGHLRVKVPVCKNFFVKQRLCVKLLCVKASCGKGTVRLLLKRLFCVKASVCKSVCVQKRLCKSCSV